MKQCEEGNKIDLKPKAVKEITLLRALERGEKTLRTDPLVSDLLSEAYSRVIPSSINSSNRFKCFTEKIKVACDYSKKSGYSGEIAAIKVAIYDNGTAGISDCPESAVYRLWMLEDWLNISDIANKSEAVNLNYKRDNVPLETIISFGGRNSGRAQCSTHLTWIIRSDREYRYPHILTVEEIESLLRQKVHAWPSLHAFHYKFDRRKIDVILKKFQIKEGEKIWYARTREAIEKIVSEYGFTAADAINK